MYVAEEKVVRVFIDAVPPNLGRLNVDRGGKDMTDLDFSNTYPLTEFSRSYGSILPTSLAYIVPLARGCSPWRPDAVKIGRASCRERV